MAEGYSDTGRAQWDVSQWDVSTRSDRIYFPRFENRAENRAQNREESACGALLRALHAPGGADEARIARGCPASLCTAP